MPLAKESESHHGDQPHTGQYQRNPGHDPKPFQEQAALLAEGLAKRDGAPPPTLVLPGHNHISEIVHLGSADDTAFGEALLEFVGSRF